MNKFEIAISMSLVVTMILGGILSLLACVHQDYGWALYFLGAGIGCGLLVWVFTCSKDEPTDPCIPSKWAFDGVLKENVVIADITPADWQLEEIMTIRLEAYLKRTWRQLHDEWGYDPAATASYDDGLRTGFAIATRQVACKFNIKLEKP